MERTVSGIEPWLFLPVLLLESLPSASPWALTQNSTLYTHRHTHAHPWWVLSDQGNYPPRQRNGKQKILAMFSALTALQSTHSPKGSQAERGNPISGDCLLSGDGNREKKKKL